MHVQTSLCERRALWREWLCLHSSGEQTALGVLSPESRVSRGFKLCFTLRYLRTQQLAAVRWEPGVMSSEHSSGYFVAL